MEEYPFQDRDLSWLSFNNRVLMEATKSTVPLLERLKFVAIYSSNLDEFFRVRMASHRYLARIGKKKIKKGLGFKPKKLVTTILDAVALDLQKYGEIYRKLLSELKEEGIYIGPKPTELPEKAEKELLHFFKTCVLALLRPQLPASDKEIFLDNQHLYFAVKMFDDSGMERIAFLNIPSNKLNRFYYYKQDNNHYYIYLDDIIRRHLDLVFPGQRIIECISVKLNKDADLYIDDEYSGDLVTKIEKQVEKRNLGTPSRFLFDSKISKRFLSEIVQILKLEKEDLVEGGTYHNLNDLMEIDPGKPELLYPKHEKINHPEFENSSSVLAAIENKDQILHFPYQSYDYVLQFFNEAAINPEVIAIDVTFYRMADNSMIAESLITAALNGKKVTVFMEVKARFDEQNNLKWARRMKEAGIDIIYSMPGLKVHAKVAQVTARRNGKKYYYGFFGTGNLNENTANLYCDHGLFSSHQEMNKELKSVFEFLHYKKEPKGFDHLIVSQFGALENFISLIDREIRNAKDGNPAKIFLKINNLEEPDLIVKLYEAAEAGVEVRLIVRSICCAVPMEGKLEISRIVDRYLEHARLFYFYNGGEENLYAGSSDWMKRNLHNRVEVCFPVYDNEIKDQLLKIIDIQLKDNVQAVYINQKMKNVPKIPEEPLVRSQWVTYSYLKKLNEDKKTS